MGGAAIGARRLTATGIVAAPEALAVGLAGARGAVLATGGFAAAQELLGVLLATIGTCGSLATGVLTAADAVAVGLAGARGTVLAAAGFAAAQESVGVRLAALLAVLARRRLLCRRRDRGEQAAEGAQGEHERDDGTHADTCLEESVGHGFVSL